MKPLLITASSWEDRFDLGFKRIVENLPNRDVEPLVFTFVDHHPKETLAHIQNAKSTLNFIGVEIPYEEPARMWNTVKDKLHELSADRKVLIDISTMPRHLIWIILRFLEERKSENVECVYHSPEEYKNDWVTKNPGPPRIVYKLGGELEIGAKTVLLVLTGYDKQRIYNLYNSFEPDEVIFGVHQNDTEHCARAIDKDTIDSKVITVDKQFEYNAFDEDFGFNKIYEETRGYFSTGKNVLLASLGPKPSAISLYRLNRKHVNSALIYVPSKDYNLEYSQGIRDQHKLVLPFSSHLVNLPDENVSESDAVPDIGNFDESLTGETTKKKIARVPMKLDFAGHKEFKKVWELRIRGTVDNDREIKKETEDNAAKRYSAGFELLCTGKQEKAITILKLLDQDYPNCALILYTLGTAYDLNGDREKAKKYFEKALENDLENSENPVILDSINSMDDML